ncbi:MAG: hypothetical protein JW981_05230 [Anaerolineae bacterium]|nr:hypothetical protein [Anaerolineae bacterium]
MQHKLNLNLFTSIFAYCLGSALLLLITSSVTLAAPVSHSVPSQAVAVYRNAEFTGTTQIFLPVLTRHYPTVWHLSAGTAGHRFYDIAVCPVNPNIVYAGTGESGVYRSTDGGKSWEYWALEGRVTPVVVNPQNCDEAFAASWGQGVYRLRAQGGSPQVTNISMQLGESYLYALEISDGGDTLYAGTATRGVYKTRLDEIGWVEANRGVAVQRIRSLGVGESVLYAGARECTVHFSDNNADLWTVEVIIEASSCDDDMVLAVAEAGAARYAGLYAQGLYWQTEESGAWSPVAGVPVAPVFDIQPYNERLLTSVYGQGVYACYPGEACSLLTTEGLGNLNIRMLRVVESLGPFPYVLLSTDDGIWWLSLPF